MDGKLDVIVDVINGEKQYTLKLSCDETQAKYLMEVGFRTLLSVGAISVPDVAVAPTEEDKNDLALIGASYKKTLN